VDELESLKPNAWIVGSILNLYLLVEWYQCQQESSCYFVDLWGTAGNQICDPEEISRFWSHILMEDKHSSIPQKPVTFMICQHNHYFAVCFDYSTYTAWIFGRDIKVDDVTWSSGADWSTWKGPLYLRKLARLFQ
jgi:hypothetical protein